jgi:hypothetical protein
LGVCEYLYLAHAASSVVQRNVIATATFSVMYSFLAKEEKTKTRNGF